MQIAMGVIFGIGIALVVGIVFVQNGVLSYHGF